MRSVTDSIERRAAALARLLDRALRLPVDGEHIGAVDDDAVEAVRLRAVGDAARLPYSRWAGRRVRPLVVVADEDHGQRRTPARFIASWQSPRAEAPSPNQPTATRSLLADAEGERATDRDGQHRRQVADHRDQAEVRVGHVDVAVLAACRAAGAAHVLREDPPGLDAARHVHAHVAVQRRADIVGAHRRRHADRGGLVPAARVERAGNLALLVEDVAALLDAARDEHVAVDAEEILAVEARLADLGE